LLQSILVQSNYELKITNYELKITKLRLSSFLVVLISIIFGSSLAAQRTDKFSKNYLEYANRQYYFGITLGYNMSNFNIVRGNKFSVGDSLVYVSSPMSSGFNLGMIANLKMGEYFDLRFLPTLSFAERSLMFTGKEGTIVPKRLESVFIEFPFHFRYKSALYHDMRFLVVAGAKYTFDLSAGSKGRNASQQIKMAGTDFALEWGMGVQIFFPYFIFTPEVKFSHGIPNSLIYQRDLIFSSVLERASSQSITISLHFEG
jgi:Outer membrane protein beta-barrel domain